MIEFLDLHIYIRVVILAVLLLLTTVNFYTLIHLMTIRKILLSKIVFAFFSCVTAATFLYFLCIENAFVNSLHFDDYIFSQYIVFAVPFCIINIACFCHVLRLVLHKRKNTISSLSVKESVDNLPTGLCFSRKNGMVQLVNYQMNRLSYLLTGADIQNAEIFWNLVSEGETDDDVERLSSGEKPEIRFKDGRVWSFSKEKLDSVVQITATEITDYCVLTKTLEEKNAELQKMNERLRKYGETVDEVVRAKERLETKVRIHNELGQALVVTQHALQNECEDFVEILEIWRRNIAALRMEADPILKTDYLSAFMKAAESADVIVDIRGDLPKENEMKLLFMTVATEALTNAVRHAGAKNLLIEINETADFFVADFTNDGKIPASKTITEGGGLSSLRKKIERSGGEMSVSGLPVFKLRIKLYKESGETV